VYLASGLIRWVAFGGSGLIRRVASLERDKLVVFYSPSASGIWPDRRGGEPLLGVAFKEGDYCSLFVHSESKILLICPSQERPPFL
jgi:hypothetical protein